MVLAGSTIEHRAKEILVLALEDHYELEKMSHLRISSYFDRLYKIQRRMREFNLGWQNRKTILMKTAITEKNEMLFLAMGEKKGFKHLRKPLEALKIEILEAVVSRYLRFCRD